MTPETHNEYDLLREVYERLRMTVERINETKRRADNHAKLVQVHNIVESCTNFMKVGFFRFSWQEVLCGVLMSCLDTSALINIFRWFTGTIYCC